MRSLTLYVAPIFALALAACSSPVSLGDPNPGAPKATNPAEPVLAIPTPTPALTYPEGPYGKTAGAVIPDMSWDGYRDGKGDVTKVDLLDYYDPDGSKGIKVILVEMSALWCGVCRSEAARLAPVYEADWKSKGARFVTLIVEGNSHSPATQPDVDTWIKTYKCPYDVVLDASMSLAPPTGGTIGLPYNVIIDPRTMKIDKVVEGDGAGVDAALKAVISRNGG
jgi:hypothetical protein